MTGEPTHTASKEMMAPEIMFSTEQAPQLSSTALKVQWPLRFTFSYGQPVTQHYKRRTVLHSSLQSVQSPRKIQTVPVYKRTAGKPCIALPRIDTLDFKQKEQRTKVSP